MYITITKNSLKAAILAVDVSRTSKCQKTPTS